MTVPPLSRIASEIQGLCPDAESRLKMIVAVAYFLRKQNVMGGARRTLPDFQDPVHEQIGDRGAFELTFNRTYALVRPHLDLVAIAVPNGLLTLLQGDLRQLVNDCDAPNDLVAAWLYLFVSREVHVLKHSWPDLTLSGLTELPDDVKKPLRAARARLL